MKKTSILNIDGKTVEYFNNNGKFDSQLTKAEKEALKKEQKELEKLENEEEGFAI